MVWYARLFGVLRENALCAHDITYAGHYERSLLRDNDSRCYLRKMKIISSDWIALLRRLLIFSNGVLRLHCWTSRSADTVFHNNFARYEYLHMPDVISSLTIIRSARGDIYAKELVFCKNVPKRYKTSPRQSSTVVVWAINRPFQQLALSRLTSRSALKSRQNLDEQHVYLIQVLH